MEREGVKANENVKPPGGGKYPQVGEKEGSL
jgi:hypothetical protein